MKDCVLVSSGELSDNPFVSAADSGEILAAQAAKQQQVQYSGMSGGSSEGGEGNGGKDRDISRVGSKSDAKNDEHKHSKSDSDKYSSKGNSDKHSSKGSGSNAAAPASSSSSYVNSNNTRPEKHWLREGIRVKIVSKSIGSGRAYLMKSTVLDVYTQGVCSVRLDDGTVLEAVKERHVETIIPGVGGSCLVLLGAYAGQQAVVLEKKNDAQRVVVQLSEELEVVELGMDSIAATSSSR